MNDIRSVLRHSIHLDLLAYTIIVMLVIVVGLLALMLVTGLRTEDLWLLKNQVAQILLPILLGAIILYMADTHRRLRSQLESSQSRLLRARDELAVSRDRIAFALQIADIVASLSERDALRRALKESATHFDAEAAAIVAGDDVEVFTRDTQDTGPARSAALSAALRGVQSGRSDLFSISESGQEVLAAPLRVAGHLHAVACLMRTNAPFSKEDEKGFDLLGRVLELGIQNRSLVNDMRSQLQGMLSILSILVEDRQSHYTAHSAQVADLSVAVGIHLHMTDIQIENLRVAALLHDVGMLFVPKELLDAPRALTEEEELIVRRHPAKGATVAADANFSPEVQEVILSHHERIDGTGYPRGLAGHQIPLGARIIGVCDSYDAMIHDRPYRRGMSAQEAVVEMKRGAGVGFDPKVVRAFVDVLQERTAVSETVVSRTQPVFRQSRSA